MLKTRRGSRIVAAVFALLLVCSVPAVAASSHGSSRGSHHASTSHRPTGSKRSRARAAKAPGVSTPRVYHASSTRSDRCVQCDRDAHGHIVRSDKAKDAFKKATGYPKGRHGYVIDHIVPLACGGTDLPSNMQWQTAAAAKAKDKTERSGCHR